MMSKIGKHSVARRSILVAMTKLCILTRTLSRRGGQVFLSQLVRQLTAEGVDLEFVGFKPKGSEDFAGCGDLYRGLAVHLIPVPVHNNDAAQLDAYITAATEFLQANHRRFDRILLDSWYIAMAGAMAEVRPAGKLFQLVQSDPEFSTRTPEKIWESRCFRLFPRMPMQRIMVSRPLQQTFAQRYQVDYPKINMAVEPEYLRADFTVRDRPELRLISSASDFNIPSKGLAFLLESLSKLAANQPFALTLLSGAPLATPLPELPYAVTLRSIDSAAEMIRELQAHDLYLNTSTNETFCLALAEAVALGMPAIALDSVGNRDYHTNQNFVLVKDATEFEPQLRRLFSADAREMLHAAAKPSMEHYTLAESVAGLRRILEI